MIAVAMFFMMFFAHIDVCFSATVYIEKGISKNTYNISENTVISKDVPFNVPVTNIVETGLYLENRGFINGDIFVCSECVFGLRNSGTISGIIDLGSDASLVQIINTADDITHLNVNGGTFVILVQNSSTMKLTDIIAISGGADKIILDNSVIRLSSPVSRPTVRTVRAVSPVLELVGETIVEIDDVAAYDGKIILRNVSGNGTVIVNAKNLDRLYIPQTLFDDGNIFMNIVREYDYSKFLGRDLGIFINDLRTKYPDNKTLGALDNAMTWDEFNHIAERSVMLYPVKLMRPVRIFQDFAISSESNPGLGYDYITDESFDLTIIRAAGEIKYKNWNFSAAGYFGGFENDDYLNEFSGEMYGANMRAKYDDDSVLFRATIGATFAKFKTDTVFDGVGGSFDPDGISCYGAIDAGAKFNFDDAFYFIPNIGAGMDSARVLENSDTRIYAKIGGRFGTGFTDSDFQYDYNIFADIRTDNIFIAGVSADIMSLTDNAGLGLEYAVYRDEFGIAHKLSAELRIGF